MINARPAVRDGLEPKTHRKICDIKNFLDKIWWFLSVKFVILVKFEILNPKISKFEILNPKISKFEILNPNTKISNLDTKFLNFDDFCYKFWRKIILPKLTKLVITQNLTKSQNLRSLTLKSKIFDFDKIWPKIKIPPRWFIITLRFHQNSMVKIFQNWSQYGRNNASQTFFKILKSIPKSQNHQNWLKSPKFWRKFLKRPISSRTPRSWPQRKIPRRPWKNSKSSSSTGISAALRCNSTWSSARKT